MSNFKVLKILLVEDNQHMRAIVREILKAAGVEDMMEARDGAEAFEVLRQFKADIAIVDFNMMPLDGIDFTRTLRNSEDTHLRYLPIVMITGHSERARVEEARDAGVNEFVVKPMTAQALLARLNTVVLYPRDYVRTKNFFGPERRRQRGEYNGPHRRKADRER